MPPTMSTSFQWSSMRKWRSCSAPDVDAHDALVSNPLSTFHRHPHLLAHALCCMLHSQEHSQYAQKSWGGHPRCDLAPQSTSFETVALRERQHLAMAGSRHLHFPRNAKADYAARSTVHQRWSWYGSQARGYRPVTAYAVVYAVTGGGSRSEAASDALLCPGESHAEICSRVLSPHLCLSRCYVLSIVPSLTALGSGGAVEMEYPSYSTSTQDVAALRRVPDVSREARDEVWMPSCEGYASV